MYTELNILKLSVWYDGMQIYVWYQDTVLYCVSYIDRQEVKNDPIIVIIMTRWY